MKKCSKCANEKDFTDFFKDKSRKDGLTYHCRTCINKQHTKTNKIQYKKNKKYYLEKARRQHTENRKRGKERHYTINGRFAYAKSRATKNGKGWFLSIDEYKNLLSLPCHYCDNVMAPQKACGVGLDRIDNAKGYELNNVLPCCGICNSIRNDYLSVKETEIAVKAVIDYRKLYSQ